MIVPLDLRHPLGNHNPINHAWSQEDNDSFRKDGYMSIQAMIGSRWASDTTSNAVVLRFIDGSSTDGIINEISGSYLSPLCENQKQVFWIISTLKPDLHRNPAIPSSDDFYYIIPSGVTKASTPERQPKSKDPVNNAFTPSVHASQACQGSLCVRAVPSSPTRSSTHATISLPSTRSWSFLQSCSTMLRILKPPSWSPFLAYHQQV
jgi:hypothetical protein